MYTISHYQGYDMPLDIELFESHEGEAKELILQEFIDNGMYSDTICIMDDVEDEEIELEVADYLTPFEVEQLKAIEKYAPESFWESMTTQSLSDAMKPSTDEREVA